VNLNFTKMHGWGNDFVIAEAPVELSADEIRRLCDRRFGVGADGLLVVTPGSPVRMDYWNADGNRAEMCGNGFRCVARFALDRGMVSGEEFEVMTPVGIRQVRLAGEEIDVELGPVRVTGHTEIDGERYHLIDVGNPHAVVEVDDIDAAWVSVVGPRIEKDEQFEKGTNVEFVRFDDGGVEMRVWERGVGETLACGSGMVAAAFVATKAAHMESPIQVRMPGGVGSVDFRNGSGWLRGPVEYVFEGVWVDQG
jgi:diaminopimelate epimerase